MQNINFDPNAAASAASGIFGLPTSESRAQLVFIPIPWEVTTSYGGGTSQGPEAILNASKQVDLYDADVTKHYEAGLHLLPEIPSLRAWNEEGKALAQFILEAHTQSQQAEPHSENQAHEPSPQHLEYKSKLDRVNQLGGLLNQAVYQETRRVLQKGQSVGLIGGDHSVPFGALQAIAEQSNTFGILHFDAHSDTRQAYENFTWSHASIMYNVLTQIPQVTRLVQVGIRDFCEEELRFNESQGARVKTYFDRDLSQRQFHGETWHSLTQDIIRHLPQSVWISFDIDGLDPKYCPNTGTPVPGGLSFQQANFLIGAVVKSGRKIIGFDLNEVAPDLSNPNNEWDANVGARLLYKLSGWLLASQGKAKLNT